MTFTRITANPFAAGIPGPAGKDFRDPSRYFIVYQTGGNTTMASVEPKQQYRCYNCAVRFGDHYPVRAEEIGLTAFYSSTINDTSPELPEEFAGSGFCNEF